MELSQLQAIGAIVPRKLITRTIELKYPKQAPQEQWEDPEVPEFLDEIVEDSVTVQLRKPSSADSIEILRAPELEKPFVAILRCVYTPEGKPLFESLEQTQQLQMWLWLPLFTAVSEVAGIGPKASAKTTSSGVSSRSGLAAVQSANGRKRSITKKNKPGAST